MKYVGIRFVPMLAVAALSAFSHATLIDFNSVSGTDYDYYKDYESSVSTNGYLFQATKLDSWQSSPNLEQYGGNYTGSAALFACFRNDTVTMSRSDGAEFNLQSMDIANLFTQDNSPFPQTTSTITFTGLLSTGGTVTENYTTTADDLLHTVSFAGFSNLRSVSWAQDNAPYHQFDNIQVTTQAVPEPGMLAALGLGALGLLKRRKR